METLRDKSKRLLRQVQNDSETALKETIVGGKTYTEEDQKTIIDIAIFSLNDDILFIKNRLENLVSNQNIRPEIRREILAVVELLV